MKASRLLSILISLQLHGSRSAAQLADDHEVSIRTIYRDFDELSFAGVPVYSERGRAGGFRLLDNYRTRLNGLNADEVTALMLSGIGEALGDLGLSEAMRLTERKLLLALPKESREVAQIVSSRFHLDPLAWYNKVDRAPLLGQIAEAVWNDRSIKIDYESWKGLVRRRIDPIALVLKAGVWYLVGRVNTLRVYRISNIKELSATDEQFERPNDFDLAKFWGEWKAGYLSRLYSNVAVLRLKGRSVHFLEETSMPVVSSVAHSDGSMIARVQIETDENAIRAILALGSDVTVLEPRSLQLAVHEAAKAIADANR